MADDRREDGEVRAEASRAYAVDGELGLGGDSGVEGARERG